MVNSRPGFFLAVSSRWQVLAADVLWVNLPASASNLSKTSVNAVPSLLISTLTEPAGHPVPLYEIESTAREPVTTGILIGPLLPDCDGS